MGWKILNNQNLRDYFKSNQEKQPHYVHRCDSTLRVNFSVDKRQWNDISKVLKAIAAIYIP